MYRMPLVDPETLQNEFHFGPSIILKDLYILLQSVLLMEIYKIHIGFDILNRAQQDVHDEVSWKLFFGNDDREDDSREIWR